MTNARGPAYSETLSNSEKRNQYLAIASKFAFFFATNVIILYAETNHASASPQKYQCIQGDQKCPISIKLLPKGTMVSLRGKLTEGKPSVSYSFFSYAGSHLVWNYKGPETHMVLAGPNERVVGPGLPRQILLPSKGIYIYSISSNKMAENIFGKYRINMRIK